MINHEDLKKIVKEVIFNIIAQKVVDKLYENSKNILVVYSGASLGFNEGSKAIKRLIDDGFNVKVLLTKDAELVLTKDTISNILGKVEFTSESELYQLVQQTSLVVIPTMSINSAAKIANLISDTVLTKVVSHSIQIGKKVVCGIDGCCPLNKERKEIYNKNLIVTYSDKMTDNLVTLKSFGVKLSRSKNIDIKVKKEISVLNANFHKSSLTIVNKSITGADVRQCQKDSVLYVLRDATFTSLALDELSKNNINVKRLN